MNSILREIPFEICLPLKKKKKTLKKFCIASFWLERQFWCDFDQNKAIFKKLFQWVNALVVGNVTFCRLASISFMGRHRVVVELLHEKIFLLTVEAFLILRSSWQVPRN